MQSLPIMPPPVKHAALWRAGQILGVVATVVLVVGLIVRPEVALPGLWNVIIPLLPATFLVSPILWRSLCPLATLNMVSNGLVGQRPLLARMIPAVGTAGIVLLVVLVPARRFIFNEGGTALAAFIVVVGVAAFLLGMVFDAKAGFCNTICPVLPVEKLYGQHPLVALDNPRCAQCTLCTPKGCIDLAPTKAAWQAVGSARRSHAWLTTAYGVFAASFPGFVLGYFTVANGSFSEAPFIYLHMAAWAGGSYLLTWVIVRLLNVPISLVLPVLAAGAVGSYYWFIAPAMAATLGLTEIGVWGIRGITLLLVGVWLGRALHRAQRAPSGPSGERQAILAGPLPLGYTDHD